MHPKEFSYPQKERKYSYSQVGRNKAIQARSARWRFRRIQILAGNANSRYRSNQLIPAYFAEQEARASKTAFPSWSLGMSVSQ